MPHASTYWTVSPLVGSIPWLKRRHVGVGSAINEEIWCPVGRFPSTQGMSSMNGVSLVMVSAMSDSIEPLGAIRFVTSFRVGYPESVSVAMCGYSLNIEG